MYNLNWKEDTNMKKRMIAIGLLIMMLFALPACGSKTEASPAPAAQSAPAAEAAPAPAEKPAEQPAEQPTEQPAEKPAEQAEPESVDLGPAVANEKAIPDGSGIVTSKSSMLGFSFDFDSDKYVAMENMVGNIDVFAGTDEGIPRCTVAVHSSESGDAVSYLKTLVEGIETEKGKDMVNKSGDPKQIPFGDRDIYYVAYTYKDKEAGGNVLCAYYAENLKNGGIAVFTSSALEGQTQDVDAILQLAIQTFKPAA